VPVSLVSCQLGDRSKVIPRFVSARSGGPTRAVLPSAARSSSIFGSHRGEEIMNETLQIPVSEDGDEESAAAEALFDYSMEHGWGDGLPLMPPTPVRVERMIAAAGRS